MKDHMQQKEKKEQLLFFVMFYSFHLLRLMEKYYKFDTCTNDNSLKQLFNWEEHVYGRSRRMDVLLLCASSVFSI